jgi:protein SCO1/2
MTSRVLASSFALVALGLGLARPVRASTPIATQTGVDERISEPVRPELLLLDQTKRERPLGALFDGQHPVILQLAYFHCPMLCDLTLRDLAERLKGIGWQLGTDYRALTLSIDPQDTYLTAGSKREQVLSLMGQNPASDVWPFFVARKDVISAVTRSVGYRYTYDDKTGQYAHPAVTIVLTPTGKIARYLYGPALDAGDLRLALREARAGRGGVSSLVDRTILSCFHFDPSTRRYGLVILGVMRGGAALIAVVLALGVALLARLGRLRRAASSAEDPEA